MKIILAPEEAEKIFFDALCNSLGGLESYYGFQLEYDTDLYYKVRETGDCYEDVLMKILRCGGKLTLNTKGYLEDKPIGLKEVHNRVQKTTSKHLMDAILEQGDYTTGDEVLQTVFFKEVIFG